VGLLVATKFLTIIPLLPRREDSREEMGRSLVYYPVVGLFIGLILAGLNWLLNLFLPEQVVNGLLLVSLVIISGALHLDGFIDTCDGIAGHKPVEERWQVMRDSRVGAFGIVGVVLLLLVKYISLSSISNPLLMTILIMMPVISRWSIVYALFAYPYARPEGLGKSIKESANLRRFTIATVLTLALCIAAAWLTGIENFYLTGPVIILGTLLLIKVSAAYFSKIFAGLTGDNYGAINEIAEVGVLIIMTLLAQNGWLL